MNDQRRRLLKDVIMALSQAKGDLEGVISEEEEAFENMPEGLKEGEKGEKAEEILEQLKEADAGIESAIDNLDSATQ